MDVEYCPECGTPNGDDPPYKNNSDITIGPNFWLIGYTCQNGCGDFWVKK